jgi:hypothetical protein
MKEVFSKVGVEVTKENKKEIDRRIHSLVGVEYKNCSAAWKGVKRLMAEDEAAFLDSLKNTLG